MKLIIYKYDFLKSITQKNKHEKRMMFLCEIVGVFIISYKLSSMQNE